MLNVAHGLLQLDSAGNIRIDGLQSRVWFARAHVTRSRGSSDKCWMMDSGAFTELLRFGHYRDAVQAYAKHIRR